jgi:adenine-specific DNA methylase
MTQKKKLIEVALPLEAINKAAAREKSIRHGHPSTLHLWWARRPLAAARAVIFAQMVDDPSAHPDLFPTEKKQEKERQRLFRLIEDLVQWENTTNEKVLQAARDEIWESWRYACAENADHPRAIELFDRHKLPAFHDPFAGGGPTAAAPVARLGAMAEIARELAYRLYTVCERKKRAAEALSYNALVQSWPEIVRLAGAPGSGAEPAQAELL